MNNVYILYELSADIHHGYCDNERLKTVIAFRRLVCFEAMVKPVPS